MSHSAAACNCWTTGPLCCRNRQYYPGGGVAHYWCPYCQNRGCAYCYHVYQPQRFVPYIYETYTASTTNILEKETEEERPLRADDV